MPDFFEYVLWQLKNSFVFVAMLCVLALAVFEEYLGKLERLV